MAAGILSYGAYVPPTRLSLGRGSPQAGAAGAQRGAAERRESASAPEKAVAWNDEDALTMAVAAAQNALRGLDRAQVDAVLFASTTQPFREKQGAALIARALDLRRDVRSADYGGSLRAGTSALRGALDAVAAGSARRVLVVASDCRMGAPGSGVEPNVGDGAAAFLVGDADPIATVEESYAFADEIVDVWRGEGERFVHAWEERFVIQEGYVPAVAQAVRGLLERTGGAPGDFARACLYAPDARSHAEAARAAGLDRARLQDPLFGRLGNTGAAFALMQLAHALETARPGEKLLLVATGDGGEAFALHVTAQIEKLEPRRGVTWHLERRRPVKSYERYLKARGLETREWDAGSNPGLSATIHFRERDEDVSFCGQRCKKCGAVQFPAQRVCETCFARDDFERHRLSDRIGRVVTYTFDFFFPTPDPPTIVTVTEVDGARIHLQLVNTTPDQVKLDMPVEFTFRRIHEVGGRPNYYWKGTPREESAR